MMVAMLLDLVPDMLNNSEVLRLLMEAAASWVACSCCCPSTCPQSQLSTSLWLLHCTHLSTSHPLP